MIGSTVGNYQITEQIGAGGMGAVYKGLDLMLERAVAIKVLRPELAQRDPQIVERFRHEAVTLAKLAHPNIATLYSFIQHTGGEYAMVMEYVEGETLEAVVKRCGSLDAASAVNIFTQALDGVAYAHRLGIVHRDLKLANLMLTPNGVVKVMDFGIARVLGSSRMTRDGRLTGTLEYMSPEQIKGAETDARSDIYSLGVMLYELVTGRVPFACDSDYELMRAQVEDQPQPPRAFAAETPVFIEAATLRALAKNPADRFQTVEAFRDHLLAGAQTINAPDTLNICVTRSTTRLGQTNIAPSLLPPQSYFSTSPVTSDHAGLAAASSTTDLSQHAATNYVTRVDQRALAVDTEETVVSTSHAHTTSDFNESAHAAQSGAGDVVAYAVESDMAQPRVTAQTSAPAALSSPPDAPVQVWAKATTDRRSAAPSAKLRNYSMAACALLLVGTGLYGVRRLAAPLRENEPPQQQTVVAQPAPDAASTPPPLQEQSQSASGAPTDETNLTGQNESPDTATSSSTDEPSRQTINESADAAASSSNDASATADARARGVAPSNRITARPRTNDTRQTIPTAYATNTTPNGASNASPAARQPTTPNVAARQPTQPTQTALPATSRPTPVPQPTPKKKRGFWGKVKDTLGG